ncbi:hypothetical protein [Marinoscillum sp.]|uniref:hypothetical protein n=1 Tax=Marinoscillum sp. TaxID=2024838 RepID=UPI003BAB9C37
MEDLIINNVIVFDGKEEYSREQIRASLRLTRLVNAITTLGGFPTLVDRINKEGGLLYITAHPNHESGRAELRSVSEELYSEYLKITE